MGNDNLNIEKLNKIFVDKYADYLELMRVAGCSDEELDSKKYCIYEYDNLSVNEKAQVIRNDFNFLDFFTSGGIVNTDDSGKRLYDGINREVAHSVVCTMSSIKSNVEFPKEYVDEIDAQDTLPNIRDMVSDDMSALFPDMKKMFFLGQKEEFHNKMTRVFNDEKDIELFSDLVDASVKHESEAGIYQYMDMINDAISKSIGMDFSTKTHIL